MSQELYVVIVLTKTSVKMVGSSHEHNRLLGTFIIYSESHNLRYVGSSYPNHLGD